MSRTLHWLVLAIFLLALPLHAQQQTGTLAVDVRGESGPAQQVEVPVVKVTDTAGDVATSTDEQNEVPARQLFDATHKPVLVDASVSAADGSTSSVAGS